MQSFLVLPVLTVHLSYNMLLRITVIWQACFPMVQLLILSSDREFFFFFLAKCWAVEALHHVVDYSGLTPPPTISDSFCDDDSSLNSINITCSNFNGTDNERHIIEM